MKYPFVIFLIGFSFFTVYSSPQTIEREKFSTSSVLSSGIWFKIAIKDEGIYKIPYSRLKQIGVEFPSNPRIFGNNYGQLSYYNDGSHPDDLQEIAIYLDTGSDGIFNEGDFLLFYARNTGRWKYDSSIESYRYTHHNYSDSSYYFITSSSERGKLMKIIGQEVDPAGYMSYSYDALFIHEVESENLIKSGREWFQPVSALSGISINPGFFEIIPSEKIKYKIRVLGRSSVPSMFRLYEGSYLHTNILVEETNLFSTTGIYAKENIFSSALIPATSSPSFEIKFYNNGEQSARGWLDYLELQARANTVYKGKTLVFSDSRSMAPESITEFYIKNQSPKNIIIWDITNQFNPGIVQYTQDGDYCKFRLRTDTLRTFIAFNSDNALTPLIKYLPLQNQNLHASESADMVIVTHPLFRNYAMKLSELHQKYNNLKSLVVTPDEIYNEFSGGIPDIVAIRNFLRMKYLKQLGTSKPLKYLLLFGDGSYDNRKNPPDNPNFIPTYQSLNSTIVISSFVSDDFYGLLEDGEGEAEGTEDIGIGRFPVSDTSQAGIIIRKITKYLDPSAGGDWRNIIAITADDEDENTHINDAERLCSLIEEKYPEINIEKIYLDAFRQVTSVNGQSYPDVEQAINNRINSGCLIFNYIGHGNEIGLAHERVVKTQNINSWKNSPKLPLFITATCEFGKFDDAEMNPFTGVLTNKNSAGEMVLLNSEGGGIALMTTTRMVYSAPNYVINRNIINFALERDSAGNAPTLGDIIRLAKLNSGTSLNKRNFTLLGDPALTLVYPCQGKVITDSINSKYAELYTDTLKALSVVTISGHIEDNQKNLLENFNGSLFPIVFDKKKNVKTLANDGGRKIEFSVQNSIIFSGNTEIKNGKFSFRFIVPKDIDYSFGKGKISYYAKNNKADINGYFNNFIVGGFSNGPVSDKSGPIIKLYLNDTLFRNGDITDVNPVLVAILYDENGINTTGAGIGHDLTAWFNDDKSQSFILNNYYETEANDFRKGKIIYPLYDLNDGPQLLTLKAWDNYNNSSIATLKFIVKTDTRFTLNNLINYPNPFTAGTNISIGHNRPGKELDILIEISDMSGRKVKIINEKLIATGYRLPPIFWDGTLEGGKRAGRGIYNYVVIVKTDKGEISRSSGRMVIL
ncbi:MAG TPA: type IX secretion system sortase PorU [Bacteroidales bacterium]|nr:hypothetical protein [Bacteroidales bacterium]HOU96154.1 type IX secretion system sortase PorU [Bacteroidales bacterium]HQJ21412.1 type IX secretion system sortase PorU [Bacteroidales bacterium]HRC88850.1 type IX secretion system sortase PorU [Bacteroidales bacterium]